MRKVAPRIVLIISFISTGIFILGSTNNFTRLTKVSVYYESLCPFSVKFITTQLYPNYYHLKDYIQIEWIPYGWTKQSLINDKLVFTCQHGDDECKANKYQACALFQNKSQDQNMEFINCVLSNNPSNAPSVENCAKLHGFNWNAIETCSDNNEGSELLAGLGKKTHNLRPKLLLIPTVIFNDHFDKELDKRITTHFLETSCSQIPNPKPVICL
ncbi:hypothetical protein WA026_007512 [Henosepilachna vigintioctopunctata]|uniref:Gamma-interferon-inducible lysosomal thiol reductase n=1 Tax=Henosepilachna vigintioctopunctata TaxID=420089 RepID=A0AAW1UYL4_9CUCU